jgi:mitochondrial fission protein ELM1
MVKKNARMLADPLKHILIISEESPGHLSQSKGFVEALRKEIDIKVDIIVGKTTLRGFLRPFLRYFLEIMRFRCTDSVLRRITNFRGQVSGIEKPDLIVSSGGKSVFTAKILAEHFGSLYCFIGESKPYKENWFDTIITPVVRAPSNRIIECDLLPAHIEKERLEFVVESSENVWCMVIGGASRSHKYTSEDWCILADAMNEISRKNKIRWLITSSRRTSGAVEDILLERLSTECIEDAVWWSKNPEKKLSFYFSKATYLFVTQDSLSMISEAISANKPICVIYPYRMQGFPEGFLGEYLKKLESRTYITRASFCSLKDLEIHSLSLPPITNNLNNVVQKCLQVWKRDL